MVLAEAGAQASARPTSVAVATAVKIRILIFDLPSPKVVSIEGRNMTHVK
jgi:hypothetical protein